MEWGRSGEASRRLDGDVESGEHKLPFFFTDPIKWNGGLKGEEGGGGGGGEDEGQEFVIPSFGEVLSALAADVWRAPPAFRTLANMCGARHSALDAVIPFERLEATATEVLKSLPDGIWDSYGASGWGPDGKHAFMEFDYGGAWSSSLEGVDGGGGGGGGGGPEEGGGTVPGGVMPRRARDLFEGSSCAWAEFYGDGATLERVGRIFAVDYELFRWYDFDAWRVRLKQCLEK